MKWKMKSIKMSVFLIHRSILLFSLLIHYLRNIKDSRIRCIYVGDENMKINYSFLYKEKLSNKKYPMYFSIKILMYMMDWGELIYLQ